ncbi:unnamed protein product [Effrenium voratum]|nr:unnamed protein product [Effrenium voratum]
MGWASSFQAAASSSAAARAAQLESKRLQGLRATPSARPPTYSVNEAARLRVLMGDVQRAREEISVGDVSSDDSFELVEKNSLSAISSQSGKESSEGGMGLESNGDSSREGNLEDLRRRARKSGRTRQRAANRRKVRLRTPSPDFFHAAFKGPPPCPL